VQKLRAIQERMDAMSPEERATFCLSTDIRGASPAISRDGAGAENDKPPAARLAGDPVKVEAVSHEVPVKLEAAGDMLKAEPSKPVVPVVSAAVVDRTPKDRELNMVQERHVADVYMAGDSETGERMVQLLYENPAEAVPIVIGRLEGKGAEWRKVWCNGGSSCPVS
jgi:hypothetical protein